MDNFNSETYLNTLLDNFAKNYEYYSYLKIKSKNPIQIFQNNIKKVTWNEKHLITLHYYNDNKYLLFLIISFIFVICFL